MPPAGTRERPEPLRYSSRVAEPRKARRRLRRVRPQGQDGNRFLISVPHSRHPAMIKRGAYGYVRLSGAYCTPGIRLLRAVTDKLVINLLPLPGTGTVSHVYIFVNTPRGMK